MPLRSTAAAQVLTGIALPFLAPDFGFDRAPRVGGVPQEVLPVLCPRGARDEISCACIERSSERE